MVVTVEMMMRIWVHNDDDDDVLMMLFCCLLIFYEPYIL